MASGDAAAPPGVHVVASVSNTRIGLIHKTSNTRLRVLSSNGKTAMGIVGCPLAVADEPGSWEIRGGQLMADALLGC